MNQFIPMDHSARNWLRGPETNKKCFKLTVNTATTHKSELDGKHPKCSHVTSRGVPALELQNQVWLWTTWFIKQTQPVLRNRKEHGKDSCIFYNFWWRYDEMKTASLKDLKTSSTCSLERSSLWGHHKTEVDNGISRVAHNCDRPSEKALFLDIKKKLF